MRKIIGTTVLLSLLATSGLAKPGHPWYKDWKNWAVLAGTVGASIYASRAKVGCRARVGLDGCPAAGYGEFRSREILQGGIAVGAAALSIWGHQQGFKEWPVFAGGVAAFDLQLGVRNQLKQPPTVKDATGASKTYSFQVRQ